MPSVTSMSMMHEEMHEGTGQQRQPDQQAEDMRAVFGEQECAGDHSESDEYKSGAGGQKAALCRFAFTMRMIMHRHRYFPFDETDVYGTLPR
jgi:hypothetical protein